MRSAVFLSIREKATRLPKKVLLAVHGKTVTEHLIDRLRLAREPDLVVMTTSTHPDDRVLCDIADRCGIPTFRGSEGDKLVRYRDAAAEFNIDVIIVVDGDDLFCSELHIDELVREFHSHRADYLVHDGLPVGAAGFGIERAALIKVCDLKAEHDTEVWGGYFTETGRFRTRLIPVTEPVFQRPDVRMTLDYPEDLQFFSAVFDGLYGADRIPSFRDIMEYLAVHPEIVNLNKSAAELYATHLAKAAPVRLKEEAQQ